MRGRQDGGRGALLEQVLSECTVSIRSQEGLGQQNQRFRTTRQDQGAGALFSAWGVWLVSRAWKKSWPEAATGQRDLAEQPGLCSFTGLKSRLLSNSPLPPALWGLR